ncbi:MAG: right-handed parallel beta-helix repeat-containing protein [bacterium]
MKTQLLRLVVMMLFCIAISISGYAQQRQVVQSSDNSNWDDQFDTQGLNGSVTGLAVYGGNVYAGGTFTTAGGVAVNRIARWDGSSWSPLGTGVNGRVREIVIDLDKVYAGGSFTTAGGVSANHIAVWDGSSWSALGTGVDGDVYAIAVKDNEVYVGGDFQHAGGVTANNIAMYNTTTGSWSALNNGVLYSDDYLMLPFLNTGWEEAIVYDILIRGDDVFVGGGFNKAGADSAHKVAYWDGSSWHKMHGGIYLWEYSYPVCVLSLATDWAHIFAGTSDEFSPGREYMDSNADVYFIEYAYLYQWSSGMGWSAPYEAYFGYAEEPQIHALDYSSGMLFAGGEFSPESIDLGIWPDDIYATFYPDIAGNNIAMWDGSDWDSLGSGTNGAVFEVVATPNEIWVGGTFTQAGKKSSYNIGRYMLTSYPDLTCIHVPADYPTIQQAINAATDGDTIMVAPGTYTISSAIVNDRVNNLKIYGSRKQDGSDASIVDASVNPGEHFCFSFQGVTGCEISGFEIKNGVVGIFHDNCMNCTCSSNYIHHQHKVSGSNNPSGISICRSTMIDVEYCILDSNQVKGIEIWESENIDIVNNTIVNNTDKSGCMISDSDLVTIKNNIFAYNDSYGIGITHCSFTDFVHDYNCFYFNSTHPIQGYSPGAHSITVDPLFEDLTHSDYFLQTGSPCLGAGEGGVNIGALGEKGTDVSETPSLIVDEFRLFQNRPNPFNATTQISYSIPTSSRISLRIYNLRGEEVVSLFDGYQKSGMHTVRWDACYSNGHPVTSGVYLYRLQTDDFVSTRKLLLMK